MDFSVKCIEPQKKADYEPMACEEDNRSMPERLNFAVVTLQDTDEVMVVSSDWLSTDQKQCYWPPFKSTEKYVEAVKNNLAPSTGGKPWEKLNVIFHAEYDTYEEAVNTQVEKKALKDGLILYKVVTLQQSNELTVIPTTWLNEERTQCYWPPFKSPEKCTEAVKYRLDPPVTVKKPWELLNIQVHTECATYEQATKKQKSLKQKTERSSYKSPFVPLPTSVLSMYPYDSYIQAKEKILEKHTERFPFEYPMFSATSTLPYLNDQLLSSSLAPGRPTSWFEHQFSTGLPHLDSQTHIYTHSPTAGTKRKHLSASSSTHVQPSMTAGTYKQAKEQQMSLKVHRERFPVTSPLFTVPTSTLPQIYPDAGTKRKRLSASSSTHVQPSMTAVSTMEKAKQIMKQVHVNILATTQDMITTYIGDAISKMDNICGNKKITIGFFGKSGQGKSSLLNAILGKRNLLPSGCFGAYTSVVTQVEANLNDSNYIAEIELFSKEEWEKELKDLFRDLADENEDLEIKVDKITALYGPDADKKTLEELKKDDKYAEIENILSVSKKTISNSDVSAFANDVASYIQYSTGHCYWPLVKSVTIKIPDAHKLLEHIVLLDFPGTGGCNKIADDLWKTKLRKCSSLWIVRDINRAISDIDPWGILKPCIQDLGPGGECKNINFICTRTDDINSILYLRCARLSKDQITPDKNVTTECILHRNNCAKKNLEIKKSKIRFITDVFTVSSKAYLDKNPLLEPIETEIPKLQDILKSTNRRIDRELTKDYINEAKGVLSFIQSIHLHSDEKMIEMKALHRALQKNLAKALKELDCQFDSLNTILDQCLSKGVEISVKLCVDTKDSMIASVTSADKRGFHKTLQALYKNKGYFWPNNLNAPLDLNLCLAKHMHDNIHDKFNLIFPVDAKNKTEMSVQEQIDKFSIILNDTAYSPSSILYHIENFIKTEETKVKAFIKREVVHRKKDIYLSIQRTIQNQMTAGYEQAANEKGQGAMENREKIITETIELLKHNMFTDAKMEVLNKFKDLKDYICKTLESALKRSMEHLLSQTSKTTLMNVSKEIEMLESLSRQLSD